MRLQSGGKPLDSSLVWSHLLGWGGADVCYRCCVFILLRLEPDVSLDINLTSFISHVADKVGLWNSLEIPWLVDQLKLHGSDLLNEKKLCFSICYFWICLSFFLLIGSLGWNSKSYTWQHYDILLVGNRLACAVMPPLLLLVDVSRLFRLSLHCVG